MSKATYDPLNTARRILKNRERRVFQQRSTVQTCPPLGTPLQTTPPDIVIDVGGRRILARLPDE